MVEITTSSFVLDNGTKGRLRGLARHILDERDRRQWYFPRALFNEIPWQMLLVLYASETNRLSSESLCRSVLARPVTGNRWIDYLASEELVTRRVEPSDKSRSVVELAPKSIELLELYLSDRLQRDEVRAEPYGPAAQSRRSATFAVVVALVTATLSAGITYLLTSLGALPRVLELN